MKKIYYITKQLIYVRQDDGDIQHAYNDTMIEFTGDVYHNLTADQNYGGNTLINNYPIHIGVIIRISVHTPSIKY